MNWDSYSDFKTSPDDTTVPKCVKSLCPEPVSCSAAYCHSEERKLKPKDDRRVTFALSIRPNLGLVGIRAVVSLTTLETSAKTDIVAESVFVGTNKNQSVAFNPRHQVFFRLLLPEAMAHQNLKIKKIFG